jgi:hypothetical protein
VPDTSRNRASAPNASAAAIHPGAVLVVFPSQGRTRVVRTVAAVDLHSRMMYPSFCAVQ